MVFMGETMVFQSFSSFLLSDYCMLSAETDVLGTTEIIQEVHPLIEFIIWSRRYMPNK